MTDEIEIPEIKNNDNSVKLDIFLHQPKQEQEPQSVTKHDEFCTCDNGLDEINKTSLPTFDREPNMDYLDLFATLTKSIEILTDKMDDIETKLSKMEASDVNETPSLESQNKEQFQPKQETTSPTSGASAHAVNSASSENKESDEEDEEEEEEEEEVKKSSKRVETPSPNITKRDGKPQTTYPESESPLPPIMMEEIMKMAVSGNGIQKLDDRMWQIEKGGN